MEQRVELLETIDVEARLELVIAWAREVLADLELKDKIRNEVSDDLDKQQREMLLRRQMDAIRKELGESDDDAVAEYRTKLAELTVPDSVRDAIDKELDRLERMGQQNPEHAWVRNWLDAVFDLPWGTFADEHSDLGGARAVLDADHEGLDKVKERILEFLAVRVLRKQRGLGQRQRTRFRRDPRARRPSGCRQDVARRVGRRARWAVRSCGSRSAACATKPRSAGTGVPTSGRGPAASCGRSPRRAR